jgi:hypothetical protein
LYPALDRTELEQLQQTRSTVFQTLISKNNHNNASFMFIRRTEPAHAPTIESLSTVKGSQEERDELFISAPRKIHADRAEGGPRAGTTLRYRPGSPSFTGIGPAIRPRPIGDEPVILMIHA